ncbi:MAG: PDZ domain-containing protein [Nitrospinae bacterium]|nr:PDZ domain-containing protein [Nitrospinota bacterium]
MGEQHPAHKGWLGAMLMDFTPEQAEKHNLGAKQGAFVREVVLDGPAAKAGMAPDDIIIHLDKQDIKTYKEVISLVGERQPGEVIMITVMRGKTKLTLQATLEDFATGMGKVMRHYGAQKFDDLGILVRNPPRGWSGVVVEKVNPKGSAAQDGLQSGDFIQRIGNAEVKNVEEFTTLLAEKRAAGTSPLLTVRRGKSTLFISLQLPTSDGK